MDLFAFYMAFPIDDHTGDELGEETVARAHYERVQQLQLLFYRCACWCRWSCMVAHVRSRVIHHASA